MPATNPRISISIPLYRHDLLRRLAGLQGVSVSSMVGDLLAEFYPVLERVCVALEAAKQAQESSKAGVREAADRALREMEPLMAAVTAQADLFFAEVDRAFSGGPGGGAGVSARPPGSDGATASVPELRGGGQPPGSNTGVRFNREGASKCS